MSWSLPKDGRARQIGLIHVYSRAAGLSRGEYRHLLQMHSTCGATTSKDPRLTQWDFDVVMAVVEMQLEERRVAMPDPPPLPRKITDLHYWRRKNPRLGEMNSRQRHMILDEQYGLWPQLKPLLPPDKRTPDYLLGIAQHACGYRIGTIWDMKAWQASLLIEALKDRLQYAVRRAG